MPRVNPLRSTANEGNVAARIAHERESRGWSYEGLARRLSDAGYPMQPTAIFKIEKGNPPRRITVDELVGFARVFEMSVDDLLLPRALANHARAQALVKEIDNSLESIGAATERLAGLLAELLQISTDDPDLMDLVRSMSPTSEGRRAVLADTGEFRLEDGTVIAAAASKRLRSAVLDLYAELMTVAGEATVAALVQPAAARQTVQRAATKRKPPKKVTT